MGHRFSELTFTPDVLTTQKQFGSYERMQTVRERLPDFDLLRDRERQFIAQRDSFYMSTVSADGWPYIQHRGGEVGFLKVVNESTLSFANFSGNGQFQSLGNLVSNDRAALFLMDYTKQRRLKILARAEMYMPDELPSDYSYLQEQNAESYILMRVEAFDWNCPQHITPRFSEAEAVNLFELNKG